MRARYACTSSAPTHRTEHPVSCAATILAPQGGTFLQGRDVLVQPEEVVGVVLLLERLEALVLCRSVCLPDPLMALVHEEVHVHTGVIWLKGRPESMYPCPLFFEALGARGVSADVECVAGAPAVESSLVL